MATVKSKPQSFSQLAQNIYKGLPSASSEQRKEPAHVPSSADWWNVRRAQAPRDPWHELKRRK
jgi:hypothetical protein